MHIWTFQKRSETIFKAAPRAHKIQYMVALYAVWKNKQIRPNKNFWICVISTSVSIFAGPAMLYSLDWIIELDKSE